MTDDQVAKVLETLGRLDERTERLLDVVEGGEQPGLKQRIEVLEEHKNKVTGAFGVLVIIGGGIWGFLEYVFHIKK